MRLYSFTNYYLSPIQQGIQTAHLVGEMSQKTLVDNGYYHRWVNYYKTIIVLNGGNNFALRELSIRLKQLTECYDFYQTVSSFYEDRESLNGAITAVGLIVPEEVYDASKDPLNQFQTLRNFLNGFKLA